MLSRVKIQNFKSIGEPGVDLELKPLTFLVGPNGGGKSSILEAIGVTAQTSLQGRSANFSSWEDIQHKPAGTGSRIDVFFDTSLTSAHPVGRRVEIGSGGIEGYGYLPGLGDILEDQQTRRLIDGLASSELGPKTFLISSIRGSVPHETGTGTNPIWVGMNGQDLIMTLAIILGQREHDEVALVISRWAEKFGIRGLKSGLRGSNRAASDYLDSELGVALNLALASSGSRQILAVITQLFHAPTQSLLMIEEPEISLHPKAQIDVLEMFAEAIEQGKQIIATTHSLFMMQGIGYAVHKGWLEPDQVAVYHVEKKKGTGTTSKRLPLSEEGYIKGWVPSFAKVEGQLLREWTKTLPEE